MLKTTVLTAETTTVSDEQAAAPAPDDRPVSVPGPAWLLGGLALAHVTAVVVGLVSAPGSLAVGVLAGDAVLGVALAGAAVSSGHRRALPDHLVLALLLGSAVASGARGATGAPLLATTATLTVVGALALRSPRAVAAVLGVALVAVAGGAGIGAARAGDWAQAPLAVGLVAGACCATIGLARAAAQRERVADAVRRTADSLRVTDALTGALNRRGLALMAAPMLESARRRGEAVHALFVDVDGFSLVNDEIGWSRGDDVLVAVAEALSSSVRTTDVVCRVGGDEFVVLGPGTGTSPLEMERRMRTLLTASPPVSESIWPARLSIGSATLVPWDDGHLGSLLSRADQDMRLRRSLRRQSQDRRGDVAAPPRGSAPRTEV